MQTRPAFITPAEYLEREEASPVKCEYVDGEIYAMSGSKRRHNLIASNLVRHARNAADHRTQCQIFGSDMKVRVETYNCFYYPDLSICCDKNDRHELFLTHPCFIAEITSPSTASIDRREKRLSYTSLESLREYVIVDQNRMQVELYRREKTGWGGYVLSQEEDIVESSCLGMRLTLGQIYQGVEFPPAGVGEPESPEYSELIA